MTAFFMILPLAVSAFCILIAVLPQPFRKRKLCQPVYADAVVIRAACQKIYRNRGEIRAEAPVLSFATPDGTRIVTDHHFVPEWQYRYHNGETVRICYDAGNYKNFYICRDRSSDWRRASLLTAGIGILAAYGVLWIQYM